MYFNRPTLYRKNPAGSDGIPVELVVVRKKSELSIGSVAECVDVIRGDRKKVVVACIYADSVREPLRKPRLDDIIPLDAFDFEIDLHLVSESITIASRKITVDPASYLVPFRVNANALGYIET